ncbi:hypothetical protein [Bifidobacterium dentium]|uniref:hypothetical protein n=1 Tax=Bifidobacterium dentium TaxID=1689 RepID=UPI003D16DFBB
MRDIMHPDDKTCEAWSKLTPNRLTPEQAKAVSDWQARRRILDYWQKFMSLNGRQPTVREAKTTLHIGSDTLIPNLKRLRKENKLPAARKPGGMKTTGKETTMTDKKPIATENDEANEKTGAEDYEDYGNPVRQIERYVQIIDDFATETIRIRHTMYEAIKDDPTLLFADHNSLNDLLELRHSMTALIKALKEGVIDK